MTASAASTQPSAWRQSIDARDERICMLYIDGLTIDGVVAHLRRERIRLSKTRVHGILHKHGVQIRERAADRSIMTKYGRAKVLQPSAEVLADILGFGVPAVGFSDFELHGATMYQATAHVCATGQADLHRAESSGQLPNLRQQKNGETP